jgi:hypothetical protein
VRDQMAKEGLHDLLKFIQSRDSKSDVYRKLGPDHKNIAEAVWQLETAQRMFVDLQTRFKKVFTKPLGEGPTDMLLLSCTADSIAFRSQMEVSCN